MKVLAIVLAYVALAAGAPLQDNPNDGRYYPDTSGQYSPDLSGQYNPDDSGAYVDDGSGRYNGDRGDNGGQYQHIPDVFGPGDGQYHQQATNAHYSGGYVAAPNQQLEISRPPNTYLPIPEPSNSPSVVVSPPHNYQTTRRPFAQRPDTKYAPQSVKPVSGNYKWTLGQTGDHDVENPHYRLNVALPKL